MNTLPASELKRRGLAALEQPLQHGPVHILHRNRPACVVLSEADYDRLTRLAARAKEQTQGASALDWLLATPSLQTRSPDEIDAELGRERESWDTP